jgi:hypothetical protein
MAPLVQESAVFFEMQSGQEAGVDDDEVDDDGVGDDAGVANAIGVA